MKRANTFEHETTITIQGYRAEDIMWLCLGVALFSAMIWLLCDMLFISKSGLDESVVLMALGGPIAALGLVNPVRRLRNPQPFFHADKEGIRLHPGFWPSPLPWTDIRSLSVRIDPFAGGGVMSQSGMIRVLLRDSVRTGAYPFGTHEVRIPLRRLGLSRKDAADLLRRLKQIRALSCPGRDAAD